MTTAIRRAFFICAFALCAAAPAAVAGEWGIDIYGLSYHFNRDLAKQLDVDNSFNPGLGVRYQFAEVERWSFFADAGAYHDSGSNTAVYGGVGALWQVVGGLQIGGALALMNSDTYNQGKTFIAPLPLVAYDLGPVTLNLIYFPKISNYNEVASLGFWVTLWPERFK